jgi:hypothetical protein
MLAKVVIILNYYSETAQKKINSFGVDPNLNYQQTKLLNSNETDIEKVNLNLQFLFYDI